jgi:hypothetical protein
VSAQSGVDHRSAHVGRDAVNARRRLPIWLLALGLAVVAFVVWVLGIVGIGQYGEDICLDDAPVEATVYRSEGSVWPPRLTCVYEVPGGDTSEVEHRLYATVSSLWLIGFPLVAVPAIGVLWFRMARAPRS